MLAGSSYLRHTQPETKPRVTSIMMRPARTFAEFAWYECVSYAGKHSVFNLIYGHLSEKIIFVSSVCRSESYVVRTEPLIIQVVSPSRLEKLRIITQITDNAAQRNPVEPNKYILEYE